MFIPPVRENRQRLQWLTVWQRLTTICRGKSGHDDMINEWKTFLQNAGAEFDEAGVASFGNPPRELSIAITGNVFADLSHYGLIAVHGDDAVEFMQGQFINDVRKVDERHSQLSGLCNPKGRLLASFRLFNHGDSYYLCLPAEMVESVINRLRMYVLRSRVTLEEASDTFVHLGLSGEETRTVLHDFAGELPAEPGHATAQDSQVVLAVPGIYPSYEIFTTVERARALWEKLNVRSAPVGAEAWRLLDIQAGIPVIYSQTCEAFVPQMVNLQLIDGVSFKKGCYTGQEIVARMQYLGKLKRRMYRGRVDVSVAPQPGDALFSASDPQQSCGQLVSVAGHPDGGCAVLAVIQINHAEGGESLHLGGLDGPPLRLEPLPYPFPDD
jgi:folate-binding protein YgfZ